MKLAQKIVLITFLGLPLFLGAQITQEVVSLNEGRKPPSGFKKFRPNGKDTVNNYFAVNKKNIHLLIPIPNDKLRIKRVFNISSTEKNAILVVVDGNSGKPTGNNVAGLLDSKIPFGRIRGKRLDHSKLGDHKKLVVYVFHDDKVRRCLRNAFENCVKLNADYEYNICDLSDLCIDEERNFDEEPREQDGDVIGGQ